MGSAELHSKETYDVSHIQKFILKLEANPVLLSTFRSHAMARAHDIYHSGGIDELIGPQDKVLYIGVGSGHVANLIESRTRAKVFKVDLADIRSPDIKGDRFLLGNARHLPLQTNSCDVVTMFDMLHHCRDQEDLIIEARRVLKPGGALLLLEDTIPDKQDLLRSVIVLLVGKVDDLMNQQTSSINPHNYHSVSEWQALLVRLGFDRGSIDVVRWYWGITNFLPAIIRPDRVHHRTLDRPFESTRMVFIKSPDKSSNKHRPCL
jgi:SAM-dependent methyltransferase